MKSRLMVYILLVVVSLTSGCACPRGTLPSALVAETRQGYLQPAAIPDSLALLPPPPAPGSAAQMLDDETSRESLALRGTPRWAQAARDTVLDFPEAAGTFSCALNAPVTEQETPRLYMLLLKTRNDAGHSTGKAKDHYRRMRPFVVNKEPSCTPDAEKFLVSNGSYPSGHAAIGWAWALVLSEVAPDRTDALLARGLAFGESRVVCNVHWESDVAAGQVMGAGTVARLHADPVFRADVEAAKEELAAVRAKGFKPQRDCAAEVAAMER